MLSAAILPNPSCAGNHALASRGMALLFSTTKATSTFDPTTREYGTLMGQSILNCTNGSALPEQPYLVVWREYIGMNGIWSPILRKREYFVDVYDITLSRHLEISDIMIAFPACKKTKFISVSPSGVDGEDIWAAMHAGHAVFSEWRLVWIANDVLVGLSAGCLLVIICQECAGFLRRRNRGSGICDYCGYSLCGHAHQSTPVTCPECGKSAGS